MLDVAGAPGTYAAPLARRWYRVHVVDPVPLHVEHAREERIHFAARPACQRRTSMRAINALNAEMVVLSRLVPASTRSAGETTQLACLREREDQMGPESARARLAMLPHHAGAPPLGRGQWRPGAGTDRWS